MGQSFISPPSPLRDPRVEALVAWAQSGDQPLDDRGSAALSALQDLPPDERTAPALAVAAAAAYARVALRGPRDLHAGHALVRLLGALGEAGPIELVRLRERIHYHHARRRIARELTAAGQRLGVTLAELEDRFGGPVLAADLTMSVPVGSFEALVSVSDDLRRVRTSWRGLDGAPVQRRPARAVDDPGALALLAAERRRLQTHLSDLRRRLEDAMATGRSWSADEWARRMLGDPLRSALTHRMIWRVDRDDASIPALLEANGLHDVHGDRVDIDAGAYLALWHPAQDPTLQLAWANRLAVLGIKQPIDQADREITLAQAPTIPSAAVPPYRRCLCEGSYVSAAGRCLTLGGSTRFRRPRDKSRPAVLWRCCCSCSRTTAKRPSRSRR